jgi:membrane-bound lytic murein transglycosylase D
MKFFAAWIFFIGAASLNAQTPIVPEQMEFAGIALTIREDARKEIQKDVNMLTQHAGYFSVKTTRAKMYFPIIEKILEEAGIPSDFKFLALQESSLVSDAVSSSNAVGFWQFKDFTAMEMGLRVDERVDERMNVIAASKGAAKYLNKNNQQFSNWIHTLQSYQMGVGGVKKALPELQIGATQMEVTSNTYWYVKRFLAHKIAFENSLEGDSEMKLIPYTTATKKTLGEISKELSVEESTLKEYNKWLKAETIPEDKPYTVIVPVGRLNTDFNTLWLASPQKKAEAFLPASTQVKTDSLFFVNGIPAICSKKDEDAAKLATRGKIDLDDFLKFNEMEFSTSFSAGTIFLLSKKKNTTFSEYHKVKKGENFWSISQLYGIKIKKLKRFNVQVKNEELTIGVIIWLGSKRPEIQEISENVAELNNNETFDWIPANSTVLIKSTSDSIPAKAISGAIDIPKSDSLSTTTSIINSTSLNVIASNYYTVLPKETLYSIANQHKIKVVDLVKWNSLNINETLKPGKVLLIADPNTSNTGVESTKSGSASATVHEVKPSDTLYSIARQYGVTIRDIMDWNNKKDFTLSQGERLQIKNR